MNGHVRSRVSAWAIVSALAVLGATVSLAFQIRQQASRFDALVIEDPSKSLDGVATPVESVPNGSPLRNGWESFRANDHRRWSVRVDRRSGAPMLVEGRGIPFHPGRGNNLKSNVPVTVDSLESLTRSFVATHRALLAANNSELVLNREGSGPLGETMWQVIFDRRVGGVPVQGDRYVFSIAHGNLVQFGASRWTRITTSPIPTLSAPEALDRMFAYMGITAKDGVKVLEGGALRFVPLPGASEASGEGVYAGPIGDGYRSALAYRVAVTVAGEPGVWAGLVDAHTGNVIAFYDENRYAQAKGGVYPVSNDGVAPGGTELPGYPMPYTNITVGSAASFAGSAGGFDCTPSGATATTSLNGQYVRVVDTCGPISISATCENDLNLGGGGGTDCAVPPGTSAGDTHAARSSFYHLNRAAEHARAWLPGNAWLSAKLTNNVNLNQTCNAYWSDAFGSVNFFKSGGGCANSGEIAGIFLHEWGHGFDANDGGGPDNPGEAYGDITAMLATHVSCIGRGFAPGINCHGYGNACLNCTGIRDQDWDQRANHAPTTPAVLATLCAFGDGPCAKDAHCEGYLAGETLWDLATRDLPASGLDPATSWQLVDKLWYLSRAGSGGNAYTCSGITSDGCAATSWFSKLRVQDDDDGNLANGTPHAAAIFAAFDRHKIACGTAADPSNQNSSSCPPLAGPSLTAAPGSSSVLLNWTAVPDAASYRILRSDQGCDQGSTIVATVAAPATSYTDTGLANDFTEYYRVQAVGVNATCDGVLSDCASAAPQPFAGSIAVNAAAYSCSGTIVIRVTDSNIPADTQNVTVTSGIEPGGEIVTLTRTAPGSAIYIGTIATTDSAAGSDGLLSVAHGAMITATYVDADDGQGGTNLVRSVTADVDCVAPVISNVASSQVTGQSARITWNTNEIADSAVHYGLVPPPAAIASNGSRILFHTIELTGLAECSDYAYAVRSADTVGNTTTDDAAGQYHRFSTRRNNVFAYSSTDGPIAIPDNSPVGATSTINVLESKTVMDVNVKVNITHTYDGDLTIYLISPNNTTVTLSARHGGGGFHYINTVFDDETSTPIASGTAPFTGTFTPDLPLSAADGIDSAGAWRLRVVDAQFVDVGTIDNWTLTLSYPVEECGSHASYDAHTVLGESCPTGGGGGNSVLEAGETVGFKVRILNDGHVPLTGVTASVWSTTPGVAMTDGTASYPDIPANLTADPLAPYFTAKLPVDLACGTTVEFQVQFLTNEGSWSGSFSLPTGTVNSGNNVALNETFIAGIPATWSVVNGGTGAGPAATWTAGNPGGRTFNAPLAHPVAIVDSDAAAAGDTQDEELITPLMDLTTATSVTLEFDQYYRNHNLNLAEIADVDVRSWATGGEWVTVFHQTFISSPNPNHKTINITSRAAGAPDVQVRFHYWNASDEWWWQVDNVKVSSISPPSCNQTVCSAAPASVKPVPDGSFGTAMTSRRADPAGTQIDVGWDTLTCASTGYHLLYGDLATVASYAVSGSACGLPTSGAYAWSGVPSGDLWYVLASNDAAFTEGSWGTASGGSERGGTSASGQCSLSVRDNSASCP